MLRKNRKKERERGGGRRKGGIVKEKRHGDTLVGIKFVLLAPTMLPVCREIDNVKQMRTGRNFT